jgi:(R,R)-butanediol dehydrogenase / meso-butanediol dehydrogenase / diacetyl reductase
MEKTMLAAVFMGNGKLELQERPTPELKKRDDVLLRVRAASVCGSDIQILNRPPGHPATIGAVLGHEYMGEVLEAGDDVRHVRPGDHVIISPDLRCGHCYFCQIGRTNMCENRTTLGIYLDGGFARYNVAPARAVFRLDQKVPPEIAALGEPLAVTMHGIGRVNIRPGDSVVVLGAGPIGSLFAMLAKLCGAGLVVVSEPTQGRRAYAARLGADVVVNPQEQDLPEVVSGVTPRGADIVVDAVGSLFGQAMQVARRGGKILLFGVNARAESTFRQFNITDNEFDVLGSYIFDNTLFPRVIKVLESGALPLDRLVTHRLPLDQIQGGIQLLRGGDALKVVVVP